MTLLGKIVGWIIAVATWLLLGFAVFAFIRQPDRLAAFTLMPIWFWGAIGIILGLAAYFLGRIPFSRLAIAAWVLVTALASDEPRVLLNSGTISPTPANKVPYENGKNLRVITLNSTYLRFGDPSGDIAKWRPDIVILQEIHAPWAPQLTKTIFGETGDFRTYKSVTILSRWKIARQVRNSGMRSQQISVPLPDGTMLEVIDVHLTSAATNLSLWRPSAWREHQYNRAYRRAELSSALEVLKRSGGSGNPVILAGDFNAPATDNVHRQLSTAGFADAYSIAGTGWGNTFQRRVPILRIDHIYASSHFTPIRCRAVTTLASDHRMVVADLVLKP